ncbi:protein AaeX [Burkholderia multivorans]
MIEEIHLFGIYMPTALVWAIVALIVTSLLHGTLQRLPLRLLLWQPALLELATFFLLWWGIAHLADTYFPHRIIS